LYAYLAGQTLMSDRVLDRLLGVLGAPPAERTRLRAARDRLQGIRQPEAGGGPVVHGLPGKVRAFTGRAEQLAELDRLRASRVRASAVVISAVSGTAGVGKTALAVHWAHRVRGRFPDGCLYLDLRGYDPDQPLASADGLAVLLRNLGVPDNGIPHELAERVTRYRTLLDKRRMLIVLDNAFSSEQVRSLLPGTSSCFVVVTSRDDLAGLVAREGATRIDLDVLPLEDALALLGKLLGSDRVEAEPAAAAGLVQRCARLPLALRVAAEVAVAHPAVSLAGLVGELDRYRLDVLAAGGDERAAVGRGPAAPGGTASRSSGAGDRPGSVRYA
jgi:hypothetical protein